MSVEGVARKACTRCSIQKKRCDKALPECKLCVRLRQICKYEYPSISSPTPSRLSRPDFILGLGAFTAGQARNAVIQKLGSFEPESAILRYSRAIDPYFPIISIPTLRSRLPHTCRWDEASLDLSLLWLSIILLTTTPPSSPENDSSPSEFKSLYFCIKSLVSLVEGLGVNSLEILQARILVTLFEVTHGFYPAAHISIGSIVRAADALVIYPAAENSLSHYSSDEGKREDGILTWCGITTLDRHIAIESDSYAPLTRSYTHPTYTPLEPYLCPIHTIGQDRAAPLCRFSRLFEASSLLDKLQTTLNHPTAERLFNIEEVMLIVETVTSLKTILLGEILEGREMYSGALGICEIGLLLAFENGCKITPDDSVNSNCLSLAIKSLASLVSSITSKVETFILSTQPVEFDLLPPSIMFMVYKTAALVTQRLWIDGELSEGVRRLRILRGFLKAVATRWRCCERYLRLLDEDTTPRILKAVEQG